MRGPTTRGSRSRTCSTRTCIAAAVANYAAVESFSTADGKIASASVRDLLGGIVCEVRARKFLNAAGPWVDDVRRMDDPASKPCVRLTKGVHLVFARTDLPVRESLVLADDRGRIVFVMPHDRYVLVGTTDTDFAGDPASVRTEIGDVEYLLAVLAESLPGIKLTNADVATSFAGLRALVREEKESAVVGAARGSYFRKSVRTDHCRWRKVHDASRDCAEDRRSSDEGAGACVGSLSDACDTIAGRACAGRRRQFGQQRSDAKYSDCGG